MFGEQTTEAVVLEKLFLKEFEESNRTVIIEFCPKNLTLCKLNLRNEKKQTPATVAMNPVKETTKPSQVEKGKGLQETPPAQPNLMNFIIWNTRGANSFSFRRQCDIMVKTHKPSMVVLLETKMNEHKHLIEELNFDSQIQSIVDGLSGELL